MAKQERTLISVVCPCFNEEEVIRLFYTELNRVLVQMADIDHEIILVDDGSRDKTLDRLNEIAAGDACVKVVSFSRNFGHQMALTAGVDYAGGDAVVLMDSDLQHPPAIIPQMVEKWRQGAEIVSCVRKDTANASLFKKMTSKGFYVVFNAMSDTKLPIGAADFCLLGRRAYEQLRDMPERHRFLRGMVAWVGFRRDFIEYIAPQRAAGTSKYSLAKMLRFSAEALFSFTSMPLKVATRLGVVITLAGLAYLVYIVLRAVIMGDTVQGWPSTISVVLILGGFQLTFIGLIGEYIARIFEEVKGRPAYVVKQAPLKTAGRTR
jgi:glycosyltransferase involved in cell wall biosynthesis